MYLQVVDGKNHLATHSFIIAGLGHTPGPEQIKEHPAPALTCRGVRVLGRAPYRRLSVWTWLQRVGATVSSLLPSPPRAGVCPLWPSLNSGQFLAVKCLKNARE